LQSAKLIVNPAAGRGSAGKYAGDIRASLRALGIEADLSLTREPNEATVLAERAKHDGFDLVIAVGGDGTIHEIVNGMARAAAPGVAGTLGIIPFGSGNDFVKMLDIPSGWRAACQRIAQGRTRRIDLGRMNDRFFTNNIGMGFDAQVVIEARKVTWARGPSVYMLALARNMLFSYRTPLVRIEMDGESFSQRITLLTVGNGRCSGGGFWLTPAAEIDDGLFDVCIGRQMSKRQILALVPYVMKGTHVTHPEIRMARAHKIVVSSDEPLPVHADGEIIYTGATHIEVELLPQKLELLG
jgi:diacylglycerol kinase (ATP)